MYCRSRDPLLGRHCVLMRGRRPYSAPHSVLNLAGLFVVNRTTSRTPTPRRVTARYAARLVERARRAGPSFPLGGAGAEAPFAERRYCGTNIRNSEVFKRVRGTQT